MWKVEKDGIVYVVDEWQKRAFETSGYTVVGKADAKTDKQIEPKADKKA